MNLSQELSRITDQASYLHSLNVVDLEFSSGHVLDLYVAARPAERARGLAHLQSIDAAGMLFAYDSPTYKPFTMKDMLIDLDIAWYDESGNMLDHRTYPAGHSAPVCSEEAFSYVIEAPRGSLPIADIKVASHSTAAETYQIPESVKNNAKRGLELRKKYGRGGTNVGMNTARTLAKGGSIGIEKVRHINRYFPRHANDNLDDKTSNGWIAWLLWGGSSARSWTNGIVNKKENKK